MSGNVDKKLLGAFFALRERAQKGDKKAKDDLAKLAADPQAVIKIREAAARLHAQQRIALAALTAAAASPSSDVVGEQDLDSMYDDEIAEADRVHHQLPPGSDSLDHKAMLRRMKQAASNAVAPLANTNPSAVFGAGMLGNQATVRPGELKQVVNYQAADSETTTMTLVIAPVQQQVTTDKEFVTNPLDLNGAGILGNRPYARVQWGNKGFSQAAFVDIGTGQQFTLSGTMLTIEVGLKINPNITTPSMQLAGMIASFKPIMRTAPLTFTVYADDVIVAPPINIYPIPPFAKKVWFIKQTIGDVVTLNVINFAHSPPGVFEYQAGAPIAANTQMTDPIILPNDAVAISATNAAANAQGRFVFELGI